MKIPARRKALFLLLTVCVVTALFLVFGTELLFHEKSKSPSAVRFMSTEARLQRGSYLVNAVARCPYCHSKLDWALPGAPPKANGFLAGRVFADEGFPWLTAPNLTPDIETGVGLWADETLARAIREGVGHDGRILVPTMPYRSFRRLSDEDLASVILYIRSIPAIRNELPKTQTPPMISRNLTTPESITNPVPQIEPMNQVAYGRYLVEICACEACHTPQDDRGLPMDGLAFAGGFVFETPIGRLASPNITPHPSGIPDYDNEMFVRVIRTGRVGARNLNPEMPWGYFRHMTNEDLDAIFGYLKTVRPIKHSVDNGEPATYCRVCSRTHGFGERN